MDNTEEDAMQAPNEHVIRGEVSVEEQHKQPEVEPISTSLHLRGVDDLSTKQIKDYIDMHIKPNYSFKTNKQYSYLEYRLNWINDSEINIIFDHNSNLDKRSNTYRPKKTGGEGKELSQDVDLMDEIKELNFASNNNEMQDDQTEEQTIVNDDNNDVSNHNKKGAFDGLQDESIRGASEAIALLTDFQNIRNDHSEFAELSFEDQLSAVDQAPKLQDRKCWNLILTSEGNIIKSEDAKNFYNQFQSFKNGSNDIQVDTEDVEAKSEEAIPTENEGETPSAEGTEHEMDDYRIIHLEVRYSTKLDKKVEKARKFSRYYLMHGEPDKTERLPEARDQTGYHRFMGRNAKDLITGEAPETQGLLGYSEDRKEYEISDHSRRSLHSRGGGRWRSDKYFDTQRGWRDEYRPSGHGRGGYRDSYRRENRRYGGVQKRSNNHRGNSGGNDRHRDDRLNQEDLFPDFGK